MMDAIREFLAMGGYAPYVWGAYGLSAAVLAFNAVVPQMRERRLLRVLAARTEPKQR
jgi:heme exporter protein D